MGSWGPGVFENDEAQAVVEEVASCIRGEIDGFQSSDRVGIEDVRAILACIKIESVLMAANVLVSRGPAVAQPLTAKVESIVESEGGHLSKERRQIIEQTLLEYRELVLH